MAERLASDGLLEVVALRKEYPVRGPYPWSRAGSVAAVDGVTLEVRAGETVGLVGESGSGKSTLARLVMHLVAPTDGSILLNGRDVTRAQGGVRRAIRRRVQMIFQDPYSSFDPTSAIGDSVAEPLEAIPRGERSADMAARVSELFELVGLAPQHLRRRPTELSGGQLQRAAIARALSIHPQFLVLDEPVSSLDVSTQAQVLNLLIDLQRALGIGCLFISHDLAVVRQVSDRIAVMYLGRVVEEGPADRVYAGPKHPYTAALLAAIPRVAAAGGAERAVAALRDEEAASGAATPGGCRFRARCPFAMDICATVDPPAYRADDGVVTYCHLHTSGPVLAGRPVTSNARPQATTNGGGSFS